jgi:hypothetical protein
MPYMVSLCLFGYMSFVTDSQTADNGINRKPSHPGQDQG